MTKLKSTLLLTMLLATISAPVRADHFNLSIGEPVTVAPPPPIVETIPAPPSAEYVWHAGHWRWIDGTHVWVPGHYVRRPYPQAVWVEPYWQRHGGSYVFVEGHWR